MTATRTQPNLLREADLLDDEQFAYGALILSRVIAHAIEYDVHPLACPSLPRAAAMRIVTCDYGAIISEAIPGRRMTARRIVVTQDAAELAFA
jgi:hypothetical protein